MKIGFAPFPYLLFYTDKLPESVGGCANGPVIRIKNKYKDDEGIFWHEIEHVRQWWITLGVHSFMLLNKLYKLWAEVSAYKVQLKYPPANEQREYYDLYAGFIATRYGLNVSREEVLALLRR